MGKGVLEYEWSDNSKAKWVRSKNGSVTYVCGDREVFLVDRVWWNAIVQAMEEAPISSTDVPVVGEIVGYRCWRVNNVPLLWSLHRHHIWLPGEAETGHVGEDIGGIYAFKSRSRAVSEAHGDWTTPIAIGSVALWGDAVEHTDGWRAEYGRLLSIDQVIVYGEKPVARRWWQTKPKARTLPDGDRVLAALRRAYFGATEVRGMVDRSVTAR